MSFFFDFWPEHGRPHTVARYKSGAVRTARRPAGACTSVAVSRSTASGQQSSVTSLICYTCMPPPLQPRMEAALRTWQVSWQREQQGTLTDGMQRPGPGQQQAPSRPRSAAMTATARMLLSGVPSGSGTLYTQWETAGAASASQTRLVRPAVRQQPPAGHQRQCPTCAYHKARPTAQLAPTRVGVPRLQPSLRR